MGIFAVPTTGNRRTGAQSDGILITATPPPSPHVIKSPNVDVRTVT